MNEQGQIRRQETNHGGFYATLNGKYPIDKAAFRKLVAGLSNVEFKGETNIGALAQKLSDMGIPAAEEAVNEFAEQEKHHGEVTKAILEKYAPEFLEQKLDVKKFVCPLCGYEWDPCQNSPDR